MMAKVRVLAITAYGTSSHFVEANEVDEAKAKYEAEGAERVLVGREAERYLSIEAEATAIQAMADRDPL